jgi:hypothetical protein
MRGRREQLGLRGRGDGGRGAERPGLGDGKPGVADRLGLEDVGADRAVDREVPAAIEASEQELVLGAAERQWPVAFDGGAPRVYKRQSRTSPAT